MSSYFSINFFAMLTSIYLYIFALIHLFISICVMCTLGCIDRCYTYCSAEVAVKLFNCETNFPVKLHENKQEAEVHRKRKKEKEKRDRCFQKKFLSYSGMHGIYFLYEFVVIEYSEG